MTGKKPVLVDQPSAAPSRKIEGVGAGNVAGGALGAIVVWGLGELGLSVPPEVDIAIVTLLSIGVGLGIGYFRRERA